MSSDVYESFINTIRAKAVEAFADTWSSDPDDADEYEVRQAALKFAAKYRTAVAADTYRISYQKYLMAPPASFASVRDAVDDDFRAGWEAHE